MNAISGTVFAALFCASGLLATSALAKDPIAEALQSGATEWSDGFDAVATTAPEVRTSIPILSPEIVEAVGRAIDQYSDIVARGGWPVVPADKKLKIGVRGAAVATLRERLIISGDLDQAVGVSEAFDSYVEAAVKRFQARHGIPVDGQVGDSTFAALNVPAQVRLNQLATNLTRIKMQTAKIPERFVMVNIPAAQVEAVEAGGWSRATPRSSARSTGLRRSSTARSTRSISIPSGRCRRASSRRTSFRRCRPIRTTRPNITSGFTTRRATSCSRARSTGTATRRPNTCFVRTPATSIRMGSVKINFPSKDGVYMHDTPGKGLFNNEFRFDSSGCVRIQNIRELITWLLRDTPGWDRTAVDTMFVNGERIDAKLVQRVPLFWVYITAWAVTDGVVNFRNDIYGLDGLEQFAAQAETPL